jgi:hypothetical protein
VAQFFLSVSGSIFFWRVDHFFLDNRSLCLEHPGEDDLIHQQFMTISKHLMEFLQLSTEEMRMDSTQIIPKDTVHVHVGYVVE